MVPPLSLAGLQFLIREARKEDVAGMTEAFFRSFNAPFWQYFIPDNARNRQWWQDAWAIGLENPTDRSFVVEDTENGNTIVAFSRWMVRVISCWKSRVSHPLTFILPHYRCHKPMVTKNGNGQIFRKSGTKKSQALSSAAWRRTTTR